MKLYENGVIAYEVKPCPKKWTYEQARELFGLYPGGDWEGYKNDFTSCGNPLIEPFTAISRADNKTKICPDCGKAEARAGVTRGDSIPGTDTRVVGPRFAVRITDTE